MNNEAETPAPTAAPAPVMWFWSPHGVPVVIGDGPDILDRVDADPELANFPVYLLLGSRMTTKKITGKDQTFYTPAMFRVTNHRAGWSVTELDEGADMGFVGVAEQRHFDLPKLPWALLNKVDAFLRAVYDTHGSEAIVLLTWDPAVEDNDPSGWGVVVPTQTNSAGHCDYDPASIVDDKPDHVEIVGSIHSHPQMSAFASGTDHHDQATFDGLHITYGWHGQGPTEYHIELQLQGRNWVLTSADVFEDRDRLDAPEELDTWLGKVTKHVPAPTTWSYTGTGFGHYAMGTAPGKAPASNSTPTKSGTSDNGPWHNRAANSAKVGAHETDYLDQHELAINGYAHALPVDLQNVDLSEYFVVATLFANDEHCPVCDRPVDSSMRNHRRCTHCWNFLAAENEDPTDVHAVRAKLHLDISAFTQSHGSYKGIMFLRRGHAHDDPSVVVVECTEVCAPLPLWPHATQEPPATTGGALPLV